MFLHIDRLRETRESLGLSQRELGRRCGLAYMMIHRYESGKADPSITTLQHIAEQLKVSSDYLLGLSDKPYSQLMHSDLQRDELALVDAFRSEGWAGVMRLMAERMGSK